MQMCGEGDIFAKKAFVDAGTDIPPFEKDIPLAFERMLLYASGSSPATSAAWLNLILTCLLSETPQIPDRLKIFSLYAFHFLWLIE